LGAALAKRGKILLSAQFVTLDSDEMEWRDYFLHQHRLGVTYRVCDPLGWFAMAITMNTGAALIFALLAPRELWRWLVLAFVIFLRAATALANARAAGFSARI